MDKSKNPKKKYLDQVIFYATPNAPDDIVGFEWDSHDPVNHPAHYTGQVPGIECKDVIGWFPHHVGAAMKYLWRHTGKGGIEDLRKAIKFIEFEIARLESMGGDDE